MLLDPRVLKKVAHELAGQRVLILSHRDPDFDAIGSCLGLYHALRNRGIQCQVCCTDALPENSSILPGIEEVGLVDQEAFNWSRIVVLDCARRERVSGMGRLASWEAVNAPEKVLLINIDHHQDNTRYGDINWIEPKISSVGELLFYFFKQCGWEITKEVATCLFAAIATDSLRFSHKVTAATFHAAGELIERGVNVEQLSQSLFESKPVAAFDTIKKSLDAMMINQGSRLAYTTVSDTTPHGDEVVNLLRQLDNIDVLAVFRMADNGNIRINLRSKSRFNVAEFANRYGGGGHLQSAGFTVAGSLDEVVSTIVSALESELKFLNSRFLEGQLS